MSIATKLAPGFNPIRRHARLARWVAALAICALPAVARALTGSSFEGSDGDLVAAAGIDWQSFVGSPRLKVGVDLPPGQTDDALTGKEDDVVPGVDFGSIPSNKSDLVRFYAYHERVGSVDDAHDFLYLAWVRSDTNGSANMDFEFNQSSTLTANGTTVLRTPGDMLILFGFTGGGNPTLGLSRWTATGPCEASSSGPCWGPVTPLAGIAEGAVNATTVTDPVTGGSLIPLTFGEAAIDLTAANVFPSDVCVSFGRGYVKSRSSNSFSSGLKDFIRPIDVKVTNCGTITVHKNAVPDSAQDFSFTSTPNLGVSSFVLDDDGSETNSVKSAASFMSRFQGTVSITEEPTAGWDLTDVTCTSGGTPDASIVGVPQPGVSIVAAPGETVDCTYTNTARGRIRIFQSVAPAGDPQSFDFELSGGPDAVADAFALQGGGAPHDSGTVRPGTYAIAQTDPGLAWDLQSATCDDGSPISAVSVSPGETVNCTFINLKRGEILVDEATVPAGDAQSFPFLLTGGPDAVSQPFSLTDASSPHASGLVRSGTFAATQSPVPAGWDLTSATCSDGSSPAAINLSAGEVVTCTFTHTKRGQIVVDEVTVPSGDSQSFNYSLTGGPAALNATFSLTDAATPYTTVAVKPGTYVGAQSPLPAGWDLVSATCDDGSSPSAIALSAGEVVTCTFTHAKRGTILVDVVTTPAADPQTFGFSLTGGPDAISQSFSLADLTAPRSSGLVRQGTYAAVAQPAPAGWDLASSSCSDGSSVGSIGLSAGESVTCTFNYVKRGRILVDVTTLPAGSSQSFSFTLGGGPDAISQAFSLTDAAAAHDSGAVRPGTYAATAGTTPAGWDLASSSCSDGSAPGSIGLAPAETVTCTFAYVQRGRIVVDEVTTPSGDSQSFAFSLGGGPDALNASFSLTDAAAPYQSISVQPGTYAAAQSPLPAGWDLVSATCSDGSSPAAIAIAPGEVVTCTFTHVKRGSILVDVVTTPSGDPQTFGFSLTGGPDAISQSFSLADLTAPRSSGLIRQGTYAAAAQPAPAGWDLASASCSDGSAVGSIGLAAGETVTCTFNYVKRGRIVVDEVTLPSGDPQTFAFSLGGGPDALNASFSLTDAAAPYQSVEVRPGTYAAAQSPLPAGWDLVSATCNDGSSPSAIALSAGEVVTCTFTHAKRGTILVDVVTTPSGDPQTFGFALTGGPDAISQSFSLADLTAPRSSGLVRPGTYAAAGQTPPAGWDLQSASCSDGSSVGSIGLAAGETVTCTFNYVKRGRILVDVTTVPAGSTQSFVFTLGGGPDAISQPFSLTDAAAPQDSGAVRPGTYAATPGTTPAGWDLASSSCSDGSAPSSIGLAPAETVTCTFAYVQRGRILVDEVTNPSGDPQSFPYTLTGGPDSLNASFSLTDAAAPYQSATVRPGTYVATQSPLPAGWELVSATCTDGSSPSAVVLAPGEVVTCTFTHVKRGRILVDEVTNPSGDQQAFSFTLTGGPDAISQAFSLTDTSAPHDSGFVRPGTFAITQGAIPADWDFTGASCSDGSPVDAVAVGIGEVVTCTFRHTKRGKITVVKDARPNDPQDFAFTISGPSFAQSFPLDDDADPTLPNSRTFSALPLGTYVVSEGDPGGLWDNIGISCTSSQSSPGVSVSLPARSATLNVRPGETLTCTFVNSLRGQITVIKMMEDPTSCGGLDPTQIPFEFANGWEANFILKHLERHTSPWLKSDRSYTVTELPNMYWQASSVCVFPDGSRVTGGASISVTPPPGGEVVCTFINALPTGGSIHPGSSGFWKNWSNHYTDAQFRLIMVEAFSGSPVYASLFDPATGALRSDAIAAIGAIYASGGDTDSRRMLQELTTAMLNIGVSSVNNPVVHVFQENDNVTRDTKLRLSAGDAALVRALAPCDIACGVRIGDVIDIAEATWSGNILTGSYSFNALTSSQQATFGAIFGSFNIGGNVVVDPNPLPSPHGLAIGGTFAHNWYLDNDHDGHGGAPVTTCDDAPRPGFSATSDDCDDTHAAVYPGAPEVCDGLRDNCSATGWPALGGLETDNDGDGFAECAGDCNDANAAANPGRTEVCNGVDDDCDGLIDNDALGQDTDGDGVKNLCDNCPQAANPTQFDSDHDGVGDACDVCPTLTDFAQQDGDHDGIGDKCDNCPTASNSHQDDADLDGIGDACDNCRFMASANQADIDHDGEGDLCDLNDGVILITARPMGDDGIEWQSEAGYDHWNVYKGSIQGLRSSRNYTQLPGSNPIAAKVCGLTVTWYTESTNPGTGTTAFYLVTGVAGGIESSLGTDGRGAVRPNTNPCP